MGGVVAIDIGGTAIKSAVAAIPTSLASTKLLDIHRTPTPVGDARALPDAVVRITRAYGPAIEAVGLVMPGILDVEQGSVRIAGNLRLENEPIVGPLQAALDMPIYFEHDGRAGAWAEFKASAARGLRDAAVMALGTVVSASFIIDGALRNSAGFISGGLALAGETLFRPMREGLAEVSKFQRIPTIVAGTLQADASCLGAAILALQGVGLT